MRPAQNKLMEVITWFFKEGGAFFDLADLLLLAISDCLWGCCINLVFFNLWQTWIKWSFNWCFRLKCTTFNSHFAFIQIIIQSILQWCLASNGTILMWRLFVGEAIIRDYFSHLSKFTFKALGILNPYKPIPLIFHFLFIILECSFQKAINSILKQFKR